MKDHKGAGGSSSTSALLQAASSASSYRQRAVTGSSCKATYSVCRTHAISSHQISLFSVMVTAMVLDHLRIWSILLVRTHLARGLMKMWPET